MFKRYPPENVSTENQPKLDGMDNEVKRGLHLWSMITSNKMLIIGGVIVIFFLFMAIFAPLITQFSPTKMNFRAKFAPPSAEHLMGTDHFGRDTYTRIVYGARVSFQVGLVAVSIGLIGGLIFGAIAGYVGGIVDDAVCLPLGEDLFLVGVWGSVLPNTQMSA